MATLNKNEFYELRNSIYGGLAKQGIITESDVTFIEIENIIINSEGIRIDWEDESEINSRDEAITHRFKCILEDLEVIEQNTNGEDLDKITSKGCALISHFVNIKVACDLDDDESLGWAVADKSDWEDNDVDGSAFLNVTSQVSTLKQGKRLDSIIQALHNFKDGDSIDGETMEYILGQVGMTDQMLRQLVMKSDTETLGNLCEEKKELEVLPICYKIKDKVYLLGETSEVTYGVDNNDITTYELFDMTTEIKNGQSYSFYCTSVECFLEATIEERQMVRDFLCGVV